LPHQAGNTILEPKATWQGKKQGFWVWCKVCTRPLYQFYTVLEAALFRLSSHGCPVPAVIFLIVL
jgi:hypothetical protein